MNIKEFQKKLSDILAMAKEDGNQISVSKVEAFFKDDDLSAQQLDKVYEYLTSQKVQVLNWDSTQESLSEEETAQVIAAPLNAEEQSYLEKYKETLAQLPSVEDVDSAIQLSIKGDQQARQKVIEHYMPMVVDVALELHHEQVTLADTIAEGNVHLLMAVNRLESADNATEEIRKGIKAGIQYMIDEQTTQKHHDEIMVDKVQKLEAAIKDITDGDEKLEFSVDELSIFLDMSKEEIEDILRLAGEDK